jgi:hypothetical protein
MFRKYLAYFALSALAQVSFAADEPTRISAKCLNKIEKFAGVFAIANQMYLGEGSKVTIRKVTINPSAMTIGDSSGFAKGSGRFDFTVKFEGEKPQTSNTKFHFTYAMEPHCSIMSIKVDGLQD